MSQIKLIGYMSFCDQFQKDQQILLQSFNLLLNYSKKYKTPNFIIKISWALSNWLKSQILLENINQKQLENSINYLIQYSCSDKEKIASNCTRGIGFFLNQLHNNNKDKDDNKRKQNKNIKFNQLQKKCVQTIINNLDHTIIKVRTNSTKTLKPMSSLLCHYNCLALLTPLLQQNLLKNNYHLQTQTLLLIKQLPNPISPSRLLSIYLTILKNLLNRSQLQYQLSEIKTVKLLRKIILQEIVEYVDMWKLIEQEKDILLSVWMYFVDCYKDDKSSSNSNNINNNSNNSINNNSNNNNSSMSTNNDNNQTTTTTNNNTHSTTHNKMNINKNILQKQYQKGEQVQKLIFNIKNLKYDQQNIITTQTTLKGFMFIVKQSDLQLISKFKQIGLNKDKYKLIDQWGQLNNIHIHEKDGVVEIGNIFL